MSKLNLFRLALFATLVSQAGGAYADNNRKNHAGASCVASAGAVKIDGNGYGGNAGGSTATFICPIVGEPRIGGNQTGDVFVSDMHYNENACCSSRAKDPGGQALKFTADKCTSGVDGSVQLVFDGPISSGTWSHRFFQCTVPGTYQGNLSKVLTFRSTEL